MTASPAASQAITQQTTGHDLGLRRFAQPPWAESAILMLAALVRFWRLSYHSIWFDESVSLKWAGSDPSYIWQVTFPLVQDKHPPLYYLYLHYWQRMLEPFGLSTSDPALRISGGLLGVLTVAGILLVAARIGTRPTGLLAGGLVALSPLLVWYSQELRMFQPATTGIVWAACALALAWQADDRRRRYVWWVLLALCLTAALYSYLFSAFILPAAGLTVLLLAYSRRSVRFLLEGASALAVVTLAFLPLANNAWLVNASESTPGAAFEDFVLNTFRLMQTYSVWRAAWPSTAVTGAVAIYGTLALLGLLLPRTSGSQSKLGPFDQDQVWLIVWLLTPFIIANLMLTRSGSIFDEDRYLLFLAPYFLWAVARGVMTLASRNRALGWLAGSATVISLVLALPVLWTPAMARENWRAASDAIGAYTRAAPALPGATIAHIDYTHEPLEWYLRQELTDEEAPVFFPFGGTLGPDDMETVIAPPLLGLIDFGTHTAWLTQSHLEGIDDGRLVEQFFADNFPTVTELHPAGIKVSAYMLHYRYDDLPALSESAVYPEAELAPGVTLAACEILTDAVEARDDALHPPSGWVHVRLWWRAELEVDAIYETTAQVVGTEGVWGDRLHRDGEVLDRWPTSAWLPGEYVREELDINLNPVTPPGSYPVVVGLIDAASGDTIASVTCGEVHIR